MVNIILGILLINLFIHYITKTPFTVLSCGIWGFHGKNNNNFSWNKFNILGIINDKRGGDATGRMVGKDYEHHIQKGSKTYTDFISNILNPNYKHENIIFGHTRKTSFTAKDTDGIEYTQPYTIRDGENIIGMGMHNGTLYNEKDLQEEYEVPEELEYYNEEEIIKHKPNDSQILLWTLLVKKDYSILENYEGSAALAWYDFRNEHLYLFKGESNASSYAKVKSEERPLHILQESNNIWFSSEEIPLWIISQRKFPEISSIESNTILIYEKGILIDSIVVDRKGNQYKPYNNQNNYGGYGNYGSYWSNKSANIGLPAANTTKPIAKPTKIESEIMPNLYNSIIYAKGRYWSSKTKKAHGIIHLDCTGRIKESPINYGGKYDITRPYYFIEGVMIADNISFQEYIRKYKASSNKELFIRNELVKVSVYPVHVYGEEGSMSIWETTYKDWWYYTGDIKPLFSNKTYNYNRGSLASINDKGEWRFANHIPIETNGWVNKDNTESNDHDATGGVFLDKLPFDDDYESPEDELIKKEVVEEVANALKAVQESISGLYVHSGFKLGDKALSVLESVENELSKIGDND